MAEYINREEMLKYLEENNTADEWIVGQYNADWIYSFIDSQPTADVEKVVRCKYCKRCYEKRTKRNNQLMRFCMRMDGNEYQVNANDFCSYGIPKERGADNPKITCLNCKHLMFSDMYGECNKQLKIVNPSDTCEYAEPKERGEE